MQKNCQREYAVFILNDWFISSIHIISILLVYVIQVVA